MHNSTNSINSAESDLFVIPSQSISPKIHFDNNFTFSNLDAQVLVQDSAKNLDLTLTNSTLRMTTGLPIGGNNIASFSYINDNMVNLERFDTLFLTLNSSVPNLEVHNFDI